MRTLEQVKGACRIDEEGCWIWGGGCSNDGSPRIYAPDWTSSGGAMKVQMGRRGVWHIAHPGQAMPQGHRAYGTCRKPLCVNPACIEAGPMREFGELIAREGWLKGRISRRISSRKTGRARSVMTPETIAIAQASDLSCAELAALLNVSPATAHRARRGTLVAFNPVGGFLDGLGARP